MIEFTEYINTQDGGTVIHAIQATGDNMERIRDYVDGVVDNGVLRFFSIVPKSTGEVEEGDYIISDLAGGFLGVDQEMFDAYYERLT